MESFDRLIGIPFYLIVTGCIEFVVLVVIAIGALVRLPAWGLGEYLTRVWHWTVFALILLASGCVANYVFMLIAYGRMYDCGDLTVHFIPFIPFGRWVLDASDSQPGHLLDGTSMPQLQLLWAVFAAATWGTTIFIYRAYLRDRASIQEEDERLGRTIPDLS